MAENVTKLPSAKVLTTLTSQAAQTKAKKAALSGELGQKIAEAVEKHNVHAGALKLMIRFQKMDAVKLMAFLTHFDDYRDKLKIDTLMAQNLPGMEEEAEKPKEPMFKEGDAPPVAETIQ